MCHIDLWQVTPGSEAVERIGLEKKTSFGGKTFCQKARNIRWVSNEVRHKSDSLPAPLTPFSLCAARFRYSTVAVRNSRSARLLLTPAERERGRYKAHEARPQRQLNAGETGSQRKTCISTLSPRKLQTVWCTLCVNGCS